MVYPIGKLIIPPVYKLWLRNAEGIENIPKDKAFIIAANHSSYYDTLLPHVLILPIIDKKIIALVNNTYWSNLATRMFLDWGNCTPVYVGKYYDKKKNEKSINKAIKYLKNKGVVLIFPEGTRSIKGELQRAHTGIAKLALKAKVPVLPFGIIGAYKTLPKGKIFPRFIRCEVKIGKLMYFDKYYNKKLNDKTLYEITRNIMKEIGKLIGQKYKY